jgi:uncharacterized membrane protein YuzA (DUF378 family)
MIFFFCDMQTMFFCQAIPTSYDNVLNIIVAIGAFNWLIYETNAGTELVGYLMQFLGMPGMASYIRYAIGILGVFVLVCRIAGRPQNCMLKKIPGKALVPLTSSTNGVTAVNPAATAAAKQATAVAKNAADHAKHAAKVATKAAVQGNAPVAAKAAQVAAKTAAKAVEAAHVAKAVAAAPVSVKINAPVQHTLAARDRSSMGSAF